MELPVDLLRTFLAVAETRSFTRGGELVNRTQSAVSQQVKRLETEVGQSLFERGNGSIRLAPGGQTLLPYARRMLGLHDEAVSVLTRPELAGRVRLGVSVDFAIR